MELLLFAMLRRDSTALRLVENCGYNQLKRLIL